MSDGAAVHGAANILHVVTEDGRPDEFWRTTLGTAILAVTKNLYAEELAEIEQARKERDLALKADECARRELTVIQNSLAACEAALANLPHETFRRSLQSEDEASIVHVRKQRERLLAEQGRLRERLIEARVRAARVATNERQETDRFARRARRAHARAKAKRIEVHDLLERMFKDVDDQLGEAWFVALAFGD